MSDYKSLVYDQTVKPLVYFDGASLNRVDVNKHKGKT